MKVKRRITVRDRVACVRFIAAEHDPANVADRYKAANAARLNSPRNPRGHDWRLTPGLMDGYSFPHRGSRAQIHESAPSACRPGRSRGVDPPRPRERWTRFRGDTRVGARAPCHVGRRLSLANVFAIVGPGKESRPPLPRGCPLLGPAPNWTGRASIRPAHAKRSAPLLYLILQHNPAKDSGTGRVPST